MHTNIRFAPRIDLGLVVIGTVLVAALLAFRGSGAASPGTASPGWPSSFPPDMDRLGLTVASADAHPQLRRDQATDAAFAEASGLASILGVTSEAYLTTNPSGELTWVIRVTGFEFEKGGPPDASGNPAPGHTLRFAYIFVPDAMDREIVTVLKE